MVTITVTILLFFTWQINTNCETLPADLANVFKSGIVRQQNITVRKESMKGLGSILEGGGGG